VLLDSNKVKTDAFRSVCLRYGEHVAQQVVEHHVEHGGLSRFIKFDRLFQDLLGRPPAPGERESLLADFAAACRTGLGTCPVDPAARQLLDGLRAIGAERHVVSGGLEEEVRWAMAQHGLVESFTGVHGSPRSKAEILRGLLPSGGNQVHGVFVGDSQIDMEVAEQYHLQRVFVSHWTEFAGWREYVAVRPDIMVVSGLHELLSMLPSVGSAP